MVVNNIVELTYWTVMGVPLGAYGTVALTYIFSKMFLSLVYSPYEGEVDAEQTASLVIPEYNEDPDLFRRGIESVVQSDYEFEEVWVVDDGSFDQRAYEVACEYAEKYDYVHAVRLVNNMGKRHAQALAFEKAAEVDVFITMDSDTVVEEDSFDELCKPFVEDDVTAVTGYPKVINNDTNLLTQLIDMRYWVAFNVERAAQSVFGVVICCCGVLSAYRYDVVMDNLDDYTNQTFGGSECSFGDDRHMTAKALQEGRVLYQSTAISHTAAPESVAEYLTQQTRWMRSFWRESMLALRWAPKRSKALTTMLFADMALPFALVTMGFGLVVVRSMVIDVTIPLFYIGVIVAISYARNALYGAENFKTFAMSPLYAGLYMAILLPLSFYALCTLTAEGWGTR